ncbi:hybrid sensor histidine kinase/response regulator [Allosphingosinicella deserti]|uniref:histidine kinase n=1 Tax=Allosphingosinicella deserti TaxID=2116704 RepID=A0A2P7QLW1_9SPHN|nr:ATP-binding protein [Sphingomonas deserti]PSJ38930.1 hybrid sensor histidine kinase/response regulator [Sphingomonas deserti]
MPETLPDAAVSASEKHEGFLAALRDHLRNEVDSDVILDQTSQRLGVHFGASRVGYMEFDDSASEMVARSHWTDGSVVEMVGRFSFPAFGAAITTSHRKGEIWIQESRDNPRLDEAGRAACAAYDIDAAITVPLIKNDQLVSILSVQQKDARAWSDADVDLVAEVAERTWATLERAKAEAARRESDALLSAIMTHAPIGIYLKDESGRYLLANPEVARRLGRSPSELVGRGAADLFDPAMARDIARLDRDALAGGRLKVVEQSLGGDETALAMRFPVQIDADAPLRLAGFDVDITALKRAERELERSREALYQSEKLNALGSLLAGVSHELNNPIAIILAQAELLELQTAGTDAAGRAGKIRRAAERSARIVQTFLAMARQRSPQHAPVSINDVVNAALDLTEYGLRSNGVQLERRLACGLPLLMADADQLHQVIVNLIVNAQQAMQGQSGLRALYVSTARGDDPGTVKVDVADTGPGVPIELRRRIFEPFFTTKPQEMGTGVGLSFSQGLVEAHGGKLEVHDHGSGATFRMILPIGDIAAAAPQGIALTARTDEGLTALVVDDEADIAEALAALLQLEGYRCAVAGGGMEAQTRLRSESYDLVISDLRMPDLDGAALFTWLQRDRPDLARRFAFSTGDTLSPSAVRFLARAGRPFLEKPFTRAGLQHLLGEMLALESAA